MNKRRKTMNRIPPAETNTILNISPAETKTILNISPSEASPPAESVANNFDLLIEILLRIPAKSTMRFRCVSKHWLSLLSDSRFSTNHFVRNPRPSISGLYFKIGKTLNSVSLHGHRHNFPSLSFLDGLTEPSKIRVIHSCNGLLLCCIKHVGDRRSRWEYIVCNLTTKKFAVLPKLDASYYFIRGCLAFDPLKSPHHYKVVSVTEPRHIDVYNSQSLCWKRVSVHQDNIRSDAFWNGAIHWLTDGNFLMRFDIDAEEIVAIPNPESPKILPLSKIRYFGQCGDSLILIQCRALFPSGFRILEMKRDYSSWNVKCRVNLRPLISEFPDMTRRIFRVLCAVKGENERDFALVLAIPGRIVSYYVKHKTWVVLRELAPGELVKYGYNSWDSVYPFIENLFPV